MMGFVAGTLVHTDKGLVPIEQLKVGDMVLSKPESGEGEKAYKAITRVFKADKKQPIFMVRFHEKSIYDYIHNDNIKNIALYQHKIDFLEEHGDVLNRDMHLFCTSDHLFWVVSKGWVPASQLRFFDELLLSDEDIGFVSSTPDNLPRLEIDQYFPRPLEKTCISDVAISAAYGSYEAANDSVIIDFRSGHPQLISADWALNLSRGSGIHPSENTLFLPCDVNHPQVQAFNQIRLSYEYNNCYDYKKDDPLAFIENLFYQLVYNLDVENYHTYYIGTAGVWVKANK